MTSAPISAISDAQQGAASQLATSTTLIPASGALIFSPNMLCCWLILAARSRREEAVRVEPHFLTNRDSFHTH